MVFTNLALAFGATAAAIPLVIHLLNRSRFQVVEWSAMHLLQSAARVNRRRIRLEQLVLLLVRMSILAVLAFCMAGPILTGWRALSGNAKTSLVLLFDNSYSMDAGPNAATRLDQARREAMQIVRRQPRGSEVAIVYSANGQAIAMMPTAELSEVERQLKQVRQGQGKSDMAASLQAVADAFTKMRHSKRDLVIVSDFQKQDWSDNHRAAQQRAWELLSALPMRPTISFLPVGPPVTDNLAVQVVQVTPQAIGVGQEVTIRANLKNHGQRPYQGIQVQLSVDDASIKSVPIHIPAGEEAQVTFRHKFTASGSHLIQVKVDADTLLADNEYAVAVPVWERLQVLLVDGDPSPQPLRSETDFLQLALSPFAAIRERSPTGQEAKSADLFEAAVVRPENLAAQHLKGTRVVVLANVSRLRDTQVQLLTEHVESGNSLLVFAGNKLDTDWYNQQFHRGGQGLLPLPFRGLKTAEKVSHSELKLQAANKELLVNTPEEKSGVPLERGHWDHPALHLFNESQNGRLSDAKIRTWFHLASAAPVSQDQAVDATLLARSMRPTHLVRLQNGEPFLVEKSFGSGRVMQCATSCDDAWSNFPARPIYLPLMQRLVTYLATSVEPPRNVMLGDSVAARLSGQLKPDLKMKQPNGEVVQVEVKQLAASDHVVIEYQPREPGVHVLNSPTPTHFVVQVPREESDVSQLDRSRVAALAQAFDGHVVDSATEFFAADSMRRYGREMWRWLFWLLLLLCAAELLLQLWFAGKLKWSR